MRRTILAAVTGTAVLFGASVWLIDSWTRVPPAAAVASPSAIAAPPPVPQGAVAAQAPVAAKEREAPPVAPAITASKAPKAPRPSEGRQELAALARPPSPGAVNRLKVSFQLDPRLTRGLHMGDRWVSPPTWVGTQKGNLFTVRARAAGIDAAGRAFRSPTWTPSEPDMVAVSHDQGREVEITVLRPGRSQLVVSEGGATKTLLVKADRGTDTWKVEITQ